MAVIFDAEPGPRSIVASVEGLPDSGWATVEGGGFDPASVEDDRRRLERRLRERGHLDARVESEVERGEEGARVRFRSEPGPRYRIGAIVVRGALTLSPEEIRRVSGLAVGDPVDGAELRRAARTIRQIPIVAGVRIEPVREGALALLVIEVSEVRRYRFRYGIGYNSDEGPRGTVGLSDLAFLRGPRNLSILGRLGAHRKRGELSVSDPFLFFGRTVTGSVFWAEEEREGFRLSDRGAIVDVSLFDREQEHDVRGLSLRVQRREKRLFDVEISESQINRNDRDISLLSLLLAGVWDGRDDPIEPHRGWRTRVSLEYARPGLGADVGFLKAHAEVFGYVPVGWGVVLAAGARIGSAEPTAGSQEVPISERFFLGGVSNMRAFDRDAVGPRDPVSGEPLGGEAMHQQVVELRIPIWGAVGGSLFYERGQVFSDRDAFTLSEALDDAGVGLRYRTAAGAIRLDYAWEIGGVGESRVVLSLGEAF